MTTLVCLEYLYELLATGNSNLEDIIWGDGPNSEFKVAFPFLRIMLCIWKGGLGSSFSTISYKNYCKELPLLQETAPLP